MKQNNTTTDMGAILSQALQDVKKAPVNKVISKKVAARSGKIAQDRSREKEQLRSAAIAAQREIILQNNIRATHAQVSGVKIALLARAIDMEYNYYLRDFKGFGKVKALSKRIQGDVEEIGKEIERGGISFRHEIYSEDNVWQDAEDLWEIINIIFTADVKQTKEALLMAFGEEQLKEWEQFHKKQVKKTAELKTDQDLAQWIKKNKI